MPRAFTARTIDAMKPDPEKRREVPDPALPGLYLVLQPTGSKSWALRYRYGGRPRKLTLGRWPVMTLAEARAVAGGHLDEIEHGRDPGAKVAAREPDTVEALVGLFAARHLAKLRSGAEAKRVLDAFVVARWRDREVQSIKRRDVIELLEEIILSGRHTTANRVRAHLSKFLNWCVEREILDTSPVAGVRPPARERTRDRVLSDDEVRWLWAACAEVGGPWGPMARVLLLTGQRLSEVAGMTRGEIEGDTWKLGPERTKNKRPHDVPISAPARAALAALPRINGSAYFFTTTGATPVSGFDKARKALAAAMERIAAEERGEPVQIAGWGFHDLRRTAATGMARLGIPVRTTEAVLNHVSGTGGGLVAVYQRHTYAEEKRAALEAWARFVVDLVEGRAPGNVVRLTNA
jgi:integrase